VSPQQGRVTSDQHTQVWKASKARRLGGAIAEDDKGMHVTVAGTETSIRVREGGTRGGVRLQEIGECSKRANKVIRSIIVGDEPEIGRYRNIYRAAATTEMMFGVIPSKPMRLVKRARDDLSCQLEGLIDGVGDGTPVAFRHVSVPRGPGDDVVGVEEAARVEWAPGPGVVGEIAGALVLYVSQSSKHGYLIGRVGHLSGGLK